MKCEHDRDLHLVVGFGSHPESKQGQPHDQWMVTPNAYRRALL
jgi:hypothetical protein